MAVLKLVLGTDWVAIRNEILNRLAQDVAEEYPNRIYMVPELISHDTERRLCAVAGDTASRFAEVLSFTRLLNRVADGVGQAPMECLDNGGRVVAMAAAAQQLTGRLKAYAAVETKPEFLTEMVDAVDEFKRCRITSADLMAASKLSEGSLAQKLEELSLLLEAYDSLCAQGKRDPRDRETQLLEMLEDGDFAENHVFYIEGFPDFTRQHMAILEHLIRVSPMVTVGMNCDRLRSDAMAFEKAGHTAAELVQCAKKLGVEVEIETLPDRETELGILHRRLFQGSITEKVNALQVFRGKTPMTEATAAAEQVLKLVAGGCRYRDIGIVVGDLPTYRNAVELIFHRCRIPVYCSGKEDILQKTVINTVISAMEAALGGFEQRDVLRYLKSILSPLEADICDRVENYAVLWGIRGKQWTNQWVNHPLGLNREWTAADETALAQLNEARQLALAPLQRLYRGFTDASNLAQQVEALYAFLEEIRLAERLQHLAESMDAAKDNRSAQILNQLWEILISAIEQLYDVLGRTVWDGETFTRLFVLLLSQYDVGTIPPVLDSVHMGTAEVMRCSQVSHLIVLGAEEGMMPGYGGSSGLLTDQERMQLRTVFQVPLTGGAEEAIQAEFADIYGVFCGAMESVTVFCSGQPSFVYRRLAELAGGEQEITPMLGAAMVDPVSAGAYLVKWQAEDLAQRLGVGAYYGDIRKKTEHELGYISRETVQRLYGKCLKLSASQVDRQAECRMSYFLQYGLRAKERKEATVDPAEFGTYVHAVLEKTARRVMELGGFQQVSLDTTMEIALNNSDQYIAEHFAQVDSTRVSYLFRRNRRELEMVVMELWQELKNARFMPRDFELRFGDDGPMPAIPIFNPDMPAMLRGLVDRVDIWQEDGRNYFRVVDYKTGKKDFDYCDVFNGVGLQMLLYLFALEQSDYGIGAGVQYFPARAPLLTAEGNLTAEEAELLRQKEWKRKGLLLKDEAVLDAMDPENWQRLSATRKKDGIVGDLADREQFQQLRQYIFRYLSGMVSDIASGNVTANPYMRGTSHSACAFCPYGAICHKGKVENRRNYKAMDAKHFWEEVDKEVKQHG